MPRGDRVELTHHNECRCANATWVIGKSPPLDIGSIGRPPIGNLHGWRRPRGADGIAAQIYIGPCLVCALIENIASSQWPPPCRRAVSMCEVCETDASAASLTRALNELQVLNSIPDDLSVIYVHGRFYAPSLKFGKHFHSSNFAVGHCLYPSRTMRERQLTLARVGAERPVAPNNLGHL